MNKRNIQFRQVIHDRQGKFVRWHYWGYIDYPMKGIFAGPVCDGNVGGKSYQFIGIMDCNKRKVYSGDRVIFDNSDIGGERVEGEVIWCDDQTLGCLGWGLWTDKGYMHTDFLGHIEVIGNIEETRRNFV